MSYRYPTPTNLVGNAFTPLHKGLVVWIKSGTVRHRRLVTQSCAVAIETPFDHMSQCLGIVEPLQQHD